MNRSKSVVAAVHEASSSSSPSLFFQPLLEEALQRRRDNGNYRQLPAASIPAGVLQSHGQDSNNNKAIPESAAAAVASSWDFNSNDYLGLAQDVQQQGLVQQLYHNLQQQQQQQPHYTPLPSLLGSTGSRLVSGDSWYTHALETYLATRIHRRSSALLFNSGYDANLSVVSTLPCRIVLYDAEIHNSMHMGLRLWRHNHNNNTTGSKKNPHRVTRAFAHNSVADLERQLQESVQSAKEIMILVESVYSMSGDVAPLAAILDLAQTYGAGVVVDEAHSLGVTGVPENDDDQDNDNNNNNTQSPMTTTTTTTTIGCRHAGGTGCLAAAGLEGHPHLYATVYTFGKAMGCHGAVAVTAYPAVKDYWINFAYPFVYSTALPLHALLTIQAAYETVTGIPMTTNTTTTMTTSLCNNKKVPSPPPSSLLLRRPQTGRHRRRQLQTLIPLFQRLVQHELDQWTTPSTDDRGIYLQPSPTPIQALVVGDAVLCRALCHNVYRQSGGRLRVLPMTSPTVPKGTERIRFVLHAHNTETQIVQVVHWLGQALRTVGGGSRNSTSTTGTSLNEKELLAIRRENPSRPESDTSSRTFSSQLSKL